MLDRRWAWGLVLLAVAARVGAVLLLQSHKVPHSTYEHGEIAANLLAGRGFSVKFLGAEGPTSQQAPIYPLVVAAAYAVGGVGTPRALLILELGQAVLGGLLVASVLALAREVAPAQARLAVWAGLITALHPTLVYAATHVQVALLAATLLTATFAAAYRAGRTGRLSDALWCGVALGGLTLTDPILALVAPALAGAMALGRSARHVLRPFALALLAAALCVAPWMARNFKVHGEWVWVKSTFGYAFWQGNCALSEGTDKVVRTSVEQALRNAPGGLRGLNASLWAARHQAGYIDDIALTPEDYRELAALSEPERSRRLFHRALDELHERPGRYLQLCMRRLRFFLLFDETNPKTRNLLYRTSHLGLTFLAALGLALAGRPLLWRLWPTLLLAALITLFHSLTIVSARFHIPLEPLLALWAAAVPSAWRGTARSTALAGDVVRVGVLHRLRVRHVREGLPIS